MKDNVVDFPTDDIEMSDRYAFVGFSEAGELIVRLPEDHAEASQLVTILWQHLLRWDG